VPGDLVDKLNRIDERKFNLPAALTIYCDYLNINFWRAHDLRRLGGDDVRVISVQAPLVHPVVEALGRGLPLLPFGDYEISARPGGGKPLPYERKEPKIGRGPG